MRIIVTVAMLAAFSVSAAVGDETRPTTAGFYVVEEAPLTAMSRGPTGLLLRVNGNLFQCFDATGVQVGVDVRDQRRATAAVPLADGSGFVVFGDIIERINDVTVNTSHFDCDTGFASIVTVDVPTRVDSGGRRVLCRLPGPTAQTAVDTLGTSFVTPVQTLCSFDPGVDAFTVVADRSTFDGLLGPQIAGTLTRLGLPPVEGDANFTWSIGSLTAVDDGSVWFLVRLSYLTNQVAEATTVVRRAADGALGVVGIINEGNEVASIGRTDAPWLWFDEDTGLVVGGELVGALGSQGLARRFLLVWDPARPEARATFISAAGLPSSTLQPVNTPSGLLQFGLRIDRSRFDIDNDGLGDLDEALQGTDRFDSDSDGDGADDGYERNVIGTNPLDNTVPVLTPAQTSLVRLGATTLPDDWRRLHAVEAVAASSRLGGGVRMQGATDAVCAFVADGEACFDDDGDAIEPVPLPGRLAQLADGGACLFVENDVGNAVIRRDRDGTETTVYVGTSIQIVAVSCRVVFITAEESLAVTRVVDGNAFVVFDPTRACPFAGNAAELTTCTDNNLGAEPDVAVTAVPAGIDPDLGAALWIFHTVVGEGLVAVGTDRAVLLFRTAALDPARVLRRAIVEPGGRRYVLFSDESQLNRRMVTFNGAWQPLPVATPIMDREGDRFPGLFHGAIVGITSTNISYIVDPPGAVDGCSACCACGPGGVVCQVCAPGEPPAFVTQSVAAFTAWVPITEGARPGESIFFASRNQQFNLANWTLFRSTIAGAVVPFVDGPGFVALIDDDTVRDSLLQSSQASMGSIIEMQPDPSGHRLCLVDAIDTLAGGDTTVWELTLDDDGLPTTVHHVATGGLRGCAYDDDGHLALLSDSGLTVAFDDGDHDVRAALGTGRGLVRAGGRFLVRENDGVLCVDDDGETIGVVNAIDAVAPGPFGTVFFINTNGAAEVATVDGFCAGNGPRAAVHNEPTLYDAAEREFAFTQYPVRSLGNQLAVRPDGIVLFHGGDGIRTAGPTSGLLPPPMPLFHFRPTFKPGDASNRIAGLDRFRRATERGGIHTYDVLGTGAITTLPGGDPDAFVAADGWADFGLDPEPLPPDPVGEGEGEGEGEAEAEAETEAGDEGSGCDCAQSAGGDLGVGVALLVFVVVRRRHGQRSRHEISSSLPTSPSAHHWRWTIR